MAILRRELARAHASLKLEEERNRRLPEMTTAQDDAEYQRRADRAIRKFIAFLGERDLYPPVRCCLEALIAASMRSMIGPQVARSLAGTLSW